MKVSSRHFRDSRPSRCSVSFWGYIRPDAKTYESSHLAVGMVPIAAAANEPISARHDAALDEKKTFKKAQGKREVETRAEAEAEAGARAIVSRRERPNREWLIGQTDGRHNGRTGAGAGKGLKASARFQVRDGPL